MLEGLLRYVDRLDLPIYQKRDLLARAGEWLKLADRSGYPWPMAQKITFQIGSEAALTSQRNGNTQVQSVEANHSVSQQVEERP